VLQVYPEFVMVTQQMAMMEPIYQLYEQQLASREEWGETLWRDLNVTVLNEGIDGYLSKARKLSKPIRALPVSPTTHNIRGPIYKKILRQTWEKLRIKCDFGKS